MNTQYMNDDICYTHNLQILHLPSLLLLLNETQPNMSRRLSHQHRKGWLSCKDLIANYKDI